MFINLIKDFLNPLPGIGFAHIPIQIDKMNSLLLQIGPARAR
jgi:hypothetical protein